MCGFVGAISLTGAPLDPFPLKRMTDSIRHRGPDDAGYLVWQTGRSHPRGKSHGRAFTDTEFHGEFPLLPAIDSPAGEACLRDGSWDFLLGFRRLSILDPSAAGHQPMADDTGRMWLAYNGEIYNHQELREPLTRAGYRFRGHSDTETLLHAFEEQGVECIPRLNGMFAFAVWDSSRRQLHLVRDRFGIKPIYYLDRGDLLLFGSEIKALLAYPGIDREVDLLALNEYFSFQNVFTDRTLFAGIRQLPPGHRLTLDVASGRYRCEAYWDFDFCAESDLREEEACEELARLIRQAVDRQLRSDVPLGTFLSGGLDSGTVTALTARQLGRINTFTVGFDLSEAHGRELSFDEREPAEHMANVLQTEHYESVLHSGDMEAVIDELIWHLEDLRLGQSYPNFYVSRLASKFVKVALAGVGGDELFGGYPWRYAAAVGPTREDFLTNYYTYWQRLVRNLDKPRLFTGDVATALGKLDDGGAVPFRDHTLQVFRRVFGKDLPATTHAEQVRNSLYFECKTFLPGLLIVEDKLSMAHSLETRVPFLDNDLVDFASRVPVPLKVAGIDHLEKMDENVPRRRWRFEASERAGKSILRKAMERILPPAVTDARKQGFSAPDESWFRGRSEAYLRDLLLSPSARSAQYLSGDYVRRVLDQHSSGEKNHRLLIWSFLCFEKWLEAFH